MTDDERTHLRNLQDQVVNVFERASYDENQIVATSPKPITVADLRTTLYPTLATDLKSFLATFR